MKRMIKFYKTYIYILLFCVIIMTLCSFSVSAADKSVGFAGGDGTEGNPYQIATPEQLNEVRNHLDAYFIQTADIDLTEATAEGGKFYNDGKGWEPIGAFFASYEQIVFTGNYNGGGYCIIGLKCKQLDSGTNAKGLFGYNFGVIRNLGMESGAISANVSTNAGSIAGSNFGSVENCYNTGVMCR